VSSRRTVILIAAIAVGVVAVLLVLNYVSGIQNESDKNAEKQSVWQAKNDIKRGADGDVSVKNGDIVNKDIPAEFRPATAIQSTDEIKGKIALFDIGAGSVIVSNMFVDPTQAVISFRDRLENKNHQAIAFSVDQTGGVGGFLAPGDEINMLIIQDNAAARDLITDAPDLSLQASILKNSGPQPLFMEKTARYLFQKVQILAVGQNQLLTPGEQANDAAAPANAGFSGIITVNVPPEAAQLIASFASQGQSFYLSLTAKGYEPRELLPLPIVVDLLPGEDQELLTPYKYTDPEGNAG
jgi:Flp pilus assembly protein CpaB